LNRNKWLEGRREEPNYCGLCGELAGDINGLCAPCKAKEDARLEKERRIQALMEYAAKSNAEKKSISDTQREELLTHATQTDSAMTELARNMANPIRQNMDYGNIMRRFMEVRRIREDE
jgi:hypothetical protein